MLRAVRQHHYVWAHHLRRWSIDGKRVWQTTPRGKVVCDSVAGVARERDFYRASMLTPIQIGLIRRTIALADRTLQGIHLRTLNRWLTIQRQHKLITERGLGSAEIDEAFEALQSNFIETLHTGHELGARPTLDALAQQDLSVLEQPQHLVALMFFFGQQLTRTKRFRTLFFAAAQSGPNPEYANDFDDAWWLLSYILGSNVGWSLYADRRQHTLSLLTTDPAHPLIIADQPIVNLFDNPEPGKPPDFGNFYFPICPTLGLAVCDQAVFSMGLHALSADEVHRLNAAQAKTAQNFIFGNEREIVEKMCKLMPRFAQP